MGQSQGKSSESDVTGSPLIGLRVVRGPDWKWNIQDGGEGHVGTVISVRRSKSGSEEAIVVWDVGVQASYRCSDEHDLRVFDNAPTGVRHRGVGCGECNAIDIAGMRWKCTVCDDFDLCTKCYMADLHDTDHVFVRLSTPDSSEVPLPPRKGSTSVEALGFFSGSRVTRFRDWNWGNQDGARSKKASAEEGDRLAGGKEDVIGSIVGLADFGAKGVRDAAVVRWATAPEQERLYRVGHEGKVDLKCVFAGRGGRYYPTHLPLAGADDASPFKAADIVRLMVEESASGTLETVKDDGSSADVDQTKLLPTEATRQDGVVRRTGDFGVVFVEFFGNAQEKKCLSKDLIKVLRYKVGSFVKIDPDATTVMTCQRGHWVPSMSEVLGKIGKVTEVFDDGEIGVEVQSRFLVLNPLVCSPCVPPGDKSGSAESSAGGHESVSGVKAQSFEIGKIVKVIADVDLAKPLQKGHGGWNDDMKEALGKTGKVVKIHTNGDCRVKVNRQCWTFNPKCLTVASEADVDAYLQHVTSGSSSSSDSDIAGMLRSAKGRMRVKARVQYRGQPKQQKAAAFSVGDIVTVLNDLPRVVELQSGTDRSQSDLSKILGMTGKVKQILPSGNLKVTSDSGSWILNQECVLLSRNMGTTYARYKEELLPSRADLLFDSDAKLVKAIMRGAPSKVQELLDKEKDRGSKVNTKFKGVVPLHVAIIRGRVDVMKLLLDAGANVTVRDEQDNTALHHAAINGNSSVVRLLFEHKAQVDSLNKRRQTALHSAAGSWSENSAVVELLLEHGCGAHVQDSDGDTALHLAITRNHCAVIKLLVDKSLDLKIKNNSGFNALHQAVLSESIFAVTEIIAKLAKPRDVGSSAGDLVNATTPRGLTALHLAAARGYVSLTDALLSEEMVNKDLPDSRGNTPLLLAVRHGHVEVAELLVRRGADVTVKDDNGNSCLHLEAIRHRLLCGSSSACCLPSRNCVFTSCPTIPVANMMVENNDKKRALDIVTCEPVHSQLLRAAEAMLATAAASGDMAVDSAISSVASCSAPEPAEGTGNNAAVETALHEFKVGDLVQVAGNLVTLKHQQIGHGEWSLGMEKVAGKLGKIMWRFPTGDLRVHVGGHNWTLNPVCCTKPTSPTATASQTAAASAGSGLSDSSGGSSDSSAGKGMSHAASTTDSDSDSDNELIRLVAMSKASALRSRIKGTSPKKLNARVGDVAPLHVAAGRGKDEAAKILLEAGADINVCDVDHDRPLHHAAVRGQPAMIRLLLDKGARADVQNKRGHTALHYAAGASSEDVSCVKALLEHRCDVDVVNIQDSDNDTALHCAITKGHRAIIAKLVEHHPKTDLDLRNHLGFNALHYATFRGDDSTVKKIVDKAPDLVDRLNNRGQTALHMAAVHGHKSIVDMLVKAKAGVDVLAEAGGKQTPLMLAALHGRKEIVELLLRSGADATARDSNGDSCLHVALRRHRLLYGAAPVGSRSSESIALMQLLHDSGGIDWNWKDSKDRTAADIAAHLGIPHTRDDQGRFLLKSSLPPAPPSIVGADSAGTLAKQASDDLGASAGQAIAAQQQQQLPEQRASGGADGGGKVRSSSSGLAFQRDEIVKVLSDRSTVKKRQKGHGGWNDNMTSALGHVGRIVRVDSDEDVQVRVNGRKWVFNPRCLEPATDADRAALLEAESKPESQLKEGSVVRVVADRSKVRQLQQGHGGWTDSMEAALGNVGVVVDIDGDGDAKVRVAGRRWTFNPLCLELVTDPDELKKAQLEQAAAFKVGDTVKVIESLDKAKELQKGHGGWNDSMESSLGQVGTVIEIDRDDDVRVRVLGRRWVYNPACLAMASEADKAAAAAKDAEMPQEATFKPGDMVKIIADAERVEQLQNGHGGWTRSMRKALGKVGKVVEVDSDDDVRVRVHRQMWAFNPQCLEKAAARDEEEVKLRLSSSESSSSDDSGLAALLKSLEKRMASGDDSSDSSAKHEASKSSSARGQDGSSKFSVGDRVAVINDKTKVRSLQAKHGGWVSDMEAILGQTGKVKHIFPTGDLRVMFHDRRFTLNPACCTLATEAAAEATGTSVKKSDATAGESSSSSDGFHSAFRGGGDNKLVEAVTHGTALDVKKVLLKSKGKTVNSKVGGLAPLHVASGKGAVECILLLLEADADIALTDKDGDTPLHHASISGETDALQVLLDRGALPNVRNEHGLTPLHYAVLAAKGDRETTTESQQRLPGKLLQVCDVNVQDEEGDSALHLAIVRDCPAMVDQLLEHQSIDLKRANNFGWNSLHVAVRQGNDRAVEQIVTKAPHMVDTMSSRGHSALHMAATLGRKSTVELLLKGGANIKLESAQKQTALLCAAAHSHKDVVELLLESGADIDAERDEKGNTCLQVALTKHKLLYGDARPPESSLLISYLQLKSAGCPSTGQ